MDWAGHLESAKAIASYLAAALITLSLSFTMGHALFRGLRDTSASDMAAAIFEAVTFVLMLVGIAVLCLWALMGLAGALQ